MIFSRNSKLRNVIVFLTIISLAGCAAALVPHTNDPEQKVTDAYWLFDTKQRPLPAQKLILEAIEIYQEKGNDSGLAEAYIAYAIFLRSYAVERYTEHYETTGFNNGAILFKDRFNASITYLDKSRAIYEEKQEFDNLTNTYLHMGFTYIIDKNVPKSCEMYIKSLEMNTLFRSNYPDAKLNLGGFKSYKDFIDYKMKQAECPV